MCWSPGHQKSPIALANRKIRKLWYKSKTTVPELTNIWGRGGGLYMDHNPQVRWLALNKVQKGFQLKSVMAESDFFTSSWSPHHQHISTQQKENRKEDANILKISHLASLKLCGSQTVSYLYLFVYCSPFNNLVLILWQNAQRENHKHLTTKQLYFSYSGLRTQLTGTEF